MKEGFELLSFERNWNAFSDNQNWYAVKASKNLFDRFVNLDEGLNVLGVDKFIEDSDDSLVLLRMFYIGELEKLIEETNKVLESLQYMAKSEEGDLFLRLRVREGLGELAGDFIEAGSKDIYLIEDRTYNNIKNILKGLIDGADIK